MRIGVTGSHRVGKSALASALAQGLPTHRVVDEPYLEMVEDGPGRDRTTRTTPARSSPQP